MMKISLGICRYLSERKIGMRLVTSGEVLSGGTSVSPVLTAISYTPSGWMIRWGDALMRLFSSSVQVSELWCSILNEQSSNSSRSSRTMGEFLAGSTSPSYPVGMDEPKEIEIVRVFGSGEDGQRADRDPGLLVWADV